MRKFLQSFPQYCMGVIFTPKVPPLASPSLPPWFFISPSHFQSFPGLNHAFIQFFCPPHFTKSGFISLEILMANPSCTKNNLLPFLTDSALEQKYKWNLLMADEFWLDSTYSFGGQLLLSSQTTGLWSNGFQKVWAKTDVFPRMQFLCHCGEQEFLDVLSRKAFKILFGWV